MEMLGKKIICTIQNINVKGYTQNRKKEKEPTFQHKRSTSLINCPLNRKEKRTEEKETLKSPQELRLLEKLREVDSVSISL